MNKRAVNITSLVILMALLSLILEICLYYFVPDHRVAVAAAAVICLLLSHFFLERSLDYDYCFLYAALMTITTLSFRVVVELLCPNEWISFDYTLVGLYFVNWFFPFAYCFIRDFFDKGPRFSDYLFFFHSMSALFIFFYVLAVLRHFFLTPLLPPYELSPFGAHNFVPFMSTGTYIEEAVNAGNSLTDIILYMVFLCVFAVPFGFYARVYLRKIPMVLRIFIYLLVPFCIEFLQYATGAGTASIDDYALFLLGTIVGVLIYQAVYRIGLKANKRDFLQDRSVQKQLLFHL